MVSFSCENCGDVLTKKKLDPHRNQCYGASYTCLDCMVHFPGTSYRTHTACITEDQKYQGKLYKEKKPKGQQQRNNNNSNNNNNNNNSQALTPHNAYVQDAAEDNAVALVDAPPRAPTPPPAAHSLGYHEQAALPAVNVFDFLDNCETPSAQRTESRMIEDSAPPAYNQNETPLPAIADVMSFQLPDDASFVQTGYAYGDEPVRPSNERFDSYTTPAPKSKKSKKDKDLETTSKKSERKRKRSPAELDLSAAKDTLMEDAPPVLHSGLTGGLTRLLARPEFPPSPDDSGDFANSPLSPMKRAKQGTSKALMRAQREWEAQQHKEKKAEIKVERAKGDKKEKKDKKEKERGREKERKASTALVKIRPKKKKDGSAQITRRRQYDSSASPAPRDRKPKAIEYSRSNSSSPAPDGNNQLMLRPEAGELALPVSTRAELFMSFVNKGPDSDRGVSVHKALKRYHRERHGALHKADAEKELWKDMRMKRNDRGEIVLFFASESS
ncbi:uncharacterized protein M421DRAFT_60279 [Didymella exigua CBS 183.55]|uniref:Zinc finger C2H2 LYAR-type domain-containing protein n=1 Tax=Didymella exigua CBS 183.55 TaxID=1150837 RepID=A0A6A5RT51_9PLEO|nr:uncharacterized protein M421DRAFT_60279 [Didymella exigua CBS 183.55]KAF1929516.1 hypothetical protein M421DRAFT_60279 [Didymella exigua CBS 183.55]